LTAKHPEKVKELHAKLNALLKTSVPSRSGPARKSN
jgi:hypothetical protein